jgi:hypothetical protein
MSNRWSSLGNKFAKKPGQTESSTILADGRPVGPRVFRVVEDRIPILTTSDENLSVLS